LTNKLIIHLIYTTMKTIFAFILSMMIGVQFITAQDQATIAAAKPVSWNEMTHDFGTVKLNEPANIEFTFKNVGTTPVVIANVRSSCGCTATEYTKEPVKPGESGKVKATYNSAKVGPFTKSVTVTFDGIETPEVLTIKGNVEEKPVN
jgi:hypothetical protein